MSVSSYFSGFAIGLSIGMFWGRTLAAIPRDQDPDFRRSFNHENTNKPSEPPPLKFKRSNTAASTRSNPSTPKPEITPKGQGKPKLVIDGEECDYCIISYRKDCPF